MKKLLLTLLAISVAILTIASCNEQPVAPDTPTKEPNPLVGTKWYASYADYLMVLEFTSDTDVNGYFAKSNGVYSSGLTSGTYTVSGNSVKFTGLTYRWIYAYYRLESGTISGSLLSTKGQETFNIDKGEWYSWTETFTKQ